MTTYRSDAIDKVMASLSKAQGSYKKLIPNQVGPDGVYANLEATLDATRDALSQNGLGFYQYTHLLDEGTGAALLHTVLGHESGQYISSTARIITGKTDRQTGNINEIHKRIQAQMLLGIAPSKNDPIAFDDNGHEQTDLALLERLKRPAEERDAIDKSVVITKDQYNDLLIELQGEETIAQDILDFYHIQTLADLPRDEYHKARSRILRIKRTKEEYERRKR